MADSQRSNGARMVRSATRARSLAPHWHAVGIARIPLASDWRVVHSPDRTPTTMQASASSRSWTPTATCISACMRSGPVGQHASRPPTRPRRLHSTGTRPSERPRSELLCHQRVTLIKIATAEDIAMHRDLGVLPGQTTLSGGAGTGNRTPDLLITRGQIIVSRWVSGYVPDLRRCML